MSGLLSGMVLQVCTCSFHYMITLPSWHFTNFGTCSYQCPLSNFTPISLHMLQLVDHTLCHVSFCTQCATMWSIVSWDCWHSLHLLFLFVIFSLHYILFVNAWPCAAIISLPVSAFTSPIDSHRKVSSSLISCLPILVIYCPCLILRPHVFFKDSYNLAFERCVPSYFVTVFISLVLLLLLLLLLKWLLCAHILAIYYTAKGSDIISVLAPGLISPRLHTFFITRFSRCHSYSTSCGSAPLCTVVVSVMQ
jgi:hypothetical protein